MMREKNVVYWLKSCCGGALPKDWGSSNKNTVCLTTQVKLSSGQIEEQNGGTMDIHNSCELRTKILIKQRRRSTIIAIRAPRTVPKERHRRPETSFCSNHNTDLFRYQPTASCTSVSAHTQHFNLPFYRTYQTKDKVRRVSPTETGFSLSHLSCILPLGLEHLPSLVGEEESRTALESSYTINFQLVYVNNSLPICNRPS